MPRRFAKSTIILLLIIALAYIISFWAANGLNHITTSSEQLVSKQDCDDEIKDDDDMTFGLGKCEYILTKNGWPFTVSKDYTFLAIEKPNYTYNFYVDPNIDRRDDKGHYIVEYTQSPHQVGETEVLCSSKSCLFSSNNHLIIFASSFLILLLLYLKYRPTKRHLRRQ